MASRTPDGVVQAGRLCRRVAATLIAGVRRRGDVAETEDRLRALSPRMQAAITGGTLAGLFAASLLAAQFGLLGMALFLLAVVLIVG